MAATPTIDEQKLEQFMGQFVQDMGAAATAPLVVIGDKLGLYKAMADGAPVTPAELAERTGCHERYLREWLCQQAASGYVAHDASDATFGLPPEQALALGPSADGPPLVGRERDSAGFSVRCANPDGLRVLCMATAEVSDGLIVRRLSAQAWD